LNIYVYSDESGVFDKAHNKIFVFGGLLFLSKEDKDVAVRKYIRAEKTIRKSSEKSKYVCIQFMRREPHTVYTLAWKIISKIIQ